ncbi:MAG: hypothetical protein CSB34_03440 [Desulfobulbus propionicus]|nr:MAG: hypothetical protein CSB34_03440 [Desulfobulbus propionicus]
MHVKILLKVELHNQSGSQRELTAQYNKRLQQAFSHTDYIIILLSLFVNLLLYISTESVSVSWAAATSPQESPAPLKRRYFEVSHDAAINTQRLQTIYAIQSRFLLHKEGD